MKTSNLQSTEKSPLKSRLAGVSPVRDWAAWATSCLMTGTGAAMAFYSLVAYGHIASGVLFYVAEALLYAGSLLGVSVYWNAKASQALREMRLVLAADAAEVLRE